MVAVSLGLVGKAEREKEKGIREREGLTVPGDDLDDIDSIPHTDELFPSSDEEVIIASVDPLSGGISLSSFPFDNKDDDDNSRSCSKYQARNAVPSIRLAVSRGAQGREDAWTTHCEEPR